MTYPIATYSFLFHSLLTEDVIPAENIGLYFNIDISFHNRNVVCETDLQTFWSGIVRSDLFDEVAQEILHQVSDVMKWSVSTFSDLSSMFCQLLTGPVCFSNTLEQLLSKTTCFIHF